MPVPETVKVCDLFIDDGEIQLHIDVGNATICCVFDAEEFQKFRDAVNTPPHDLLIPRST